MAIAPVYANSANQIAALKELYADDKDYMKNIALIPPKIYRGYLRRLKSMGWIEGDQTVIFLREGEDEDSHQNGS